MSKPKISMIQSRRAKVDVVALEGDAVEFRAALSSVAPASRMFGKEILEHTEAAIDMTRATDGLPLTVNHSERDPSSRQLPVGRVTNIGLREDGKLAGTLSFDTDAESVAVRGKVERGVAPDISLTYRIHDYKGPSKAGEVRVTRWEPLAASIVTMPEDATVGVGRSLQLEQEAPTVEEPTVTEAPKGAETDNDDILEDVKSRSAAGYQAGLKAGMAKEGARVDTINTLSRSASTSHPTLAPDIETLAATAREKGLSETRFRSLLLDLVMGDAEPLSAEPPQDESPQALNLPGNSRRKVVTQGQQQVDVQARGMEFALLERMGPHLVKDEDMQGNQFRGWSVLNIAEQCLRNHGFETRGLSYEGLAKLAIGMRREIGSRAISPGTAGYVTSDFPAMTENIAFKALFDGFNTADRTWDRWCSTGGTPDFKQFSVPRISATSILPTVAENASYTNLTRADAKESGQAEKRGGLISYSWEAIVNNDVNSFADQSASCGEAAMATVDEEVYAKLLANGNMGDGTPLFAAGHNNTGTAALDLAGIVATRVAMGRQTDENARKLGIRLAHILVPLELQDEADNLANSEWLVDAGGSAQRINTVRNTFTVIPTHMLTDVNDWYGLARVGQTFRVFFLNGQQSPTLEQESGWDADAMHWKVRIVFDVVPQDWRGMYRNVVT